MTLEVLTWLIAIPLLGFITGMRTMTPLAVISWFAWLNLLPVSDDWCWWVARLPVVILFTLLAAVEYILDKLGLRAVFYVSGILAERHPDLLRAITGANHVVAAHGWGQNIVPAYQTAEEEAQDLARCTTVLERSAGQRPLGWLSPRCTPSTRTSLNRLVANWSARAMRVRFCSKAKADRNSSVYLVKFCFCGTFALPTRNGRR